MKKIIAGLIVFLIVVAGIHFYNSRKTVECWWSVVYPSLTFVGVEDEYGYEAIGVKLDGDIKNEQPKIKFAIFDFLNDSLIRLGLR